MVARASLDVREQMPSSTPPASRGRFAGFERVAAVTASLVGTQAITSILGFAYWVIATRQFTVHAVGLAQGATSAMQLLGSVGMLGLGTLLIRELSRVAPGTRRLLVRTALVIATGVSFVLGVLLVLGVQLFPHSALAPVGQTVPIGLLFSVGVAVTGTTLVLDQAVLATGSGLVQLERNVVASVAKIVVLLLLAAHGDSGGMAIYLSWTVGTLVSLPLVAWRTRGGLQHQTTRTLVDFSAMKGLRRAAASHHALNLALQAPPLLLGVVVILVRSAEDNGYFSTVRLVAGFVFVLPYALAVGLFAASNADERELVSRMRLTLPLGLVASLGASIVLYPLAEPVLRAFGREYASQGLQELRVIVLAGVALVVKDHFVALRRVQGRTTEAALVALLGAVVEVAAAVVGALAGGILGLTVAWVVALWVEAAVLAVPLARTYLRLRSTGASDGPAGQPGRDGDERDRSTVGLPVESPSTGMLDVPAEGRGDQPTP